MTNIDKRVTYIIGHKNPDTDSICSAIAYADLKNKTRDRKYQPRRAGTLNEETKFVLNQFDVVAPELIENVKTQVKDIDIRHTQGVNKFISLKKAWNLMQELSVVTLPAIKEDGTLEGLITVSDIAKSYMGIYDSKTLSEAHTRLSNIIETLEGKLIVGEDKDFFDKGKVLIAAANPDMMENYIEENDLVILGNRYESQLCAIEMGAACIIVCEGSEVSMTIRKLATERGSTVITTHFDTFTAARLINQSMPFNYFMKTDNLITFEEDDYIDDIREVMTNVRHRDFPILNKNGKYLGMVSRRNLLGARGKRIILVDHNEKSQAVEGMEAADLVEIIDHHRLGTVQTMGPVFFRNQPLGCTSTIIYQMYREKQLEIPKNIAGLLCAAIISDTLLFRSPTCTKPDRDAATDLASIADIKLEDFASRMFSAGSNLKDKTDEDIFYQDFKRFAIGKNSIGIGQISSLNKKELSELKDRMSPYMKKAIEDKEADMIFFMLTDILEESTTLLCEGAGAEQLVAASFHIDSELDNKNKDGAVKLPGVVSRKKQLVPVLMMGVRQ